MKRILLALLLIFLAVPAHAQTHSGPIIQASPLTITTGGTAQLLFAQTNNRGALFIENPCTITSQGIGALESLFVEFVPINTTACPGTTAGAIELAACGSFNLQANYITPQAICVQAATTAHAFIAWQQQ